MKRLFVAIDLPQRVKDALHTISCGVAGGRWMQDDQLHLTLVFIGETENSAFLDLAQALGEINIAPFPLTLRSVGHFPPRGQPKILWAGADKHEQLMALQKRVEHTALRLGLDIDKRKFLPHVTLARLSNAHEDDVGHFLQTYSLFRCEPFEVQEFHLYSSVRNPKGARYAKEASFPLTKGKSL